MLAPVAGRRYTVDDLYNFPEDGKRYEIVRGELLVTPAPRAVHQLIVAEFARRLFGYMDATGENAKVLLGPADIIYDPETWVQPDILVVPREEATWDWRTYRNLLLVVEVISPSSARGDRLVKRQAYQEHGVGTYWVVDHDAQVVEEWHPGDELPHLITDTLSWQINPGAPALTISLSSVWKAVHTG